MVPDTRHAAVINPMISITSITTSDFLMLFPLSPSISRKLNPLILPARRNAANPIIKAEIAARNPNEPLGMPVYVTNAGEFNAGA